MYILTIHYQKHFVMTPLPGLAAVAPRWMALDVDMDGYIPKASLGLRVLSYNDLSLTHPGYWIFLLHQIAKEVFATIGSIGNIDNLDDLFE